VKLRSFNGWTNYLHQITNMNSVSISGTGSIDDLHLYPSDGQMVTYVYDPLIGMISSTDTKGNTSYYDYDSNERLADIKDLNGDIVRAYNYGFAGWTVSGSLGSFTNNSTVSQTFTRNNCASGYAGGAAVYTVAAGSYQSYISQTDANAKAQDDINRNGQAYANANAGCSVIPCSAGSVTVTKTGPLSYTLTYGASVGEQAIIQVQGTNASPPQGNISIGGGTVSGTVPAAGAYSFKLLVFGSNCPSGVSSGWVTVTF